jgi:ribose 5-phosphate isomerase
LARRCPWSSSTSPFRARCGRFPPSPDGGLIADYLGPVGDPAELARRLAATPGVIEHGLFEPELVSLILIGTGAGVTRRPGGAARSS